VHPKDIKPGAKKKKKNLHSDIHQPCNTHKYLEMVKWHYLNCMIHTNPVQALTGTFWFLLEPDPPYGVKGSEVIVLNIMSKHLKGSDIINALFLKPLPPIPMKLCRPEVNVSEKSMQVRPREQCSHYAYSFPEIGWEMSSKHQLYVSLPFGEETLAH